MASIFNRDYFLKAGAWSFDVIWIVYPALNTEA